MYCFCLTGRVGRSVACKTRDVRSFSHRRTGRGGGARGAAAPPDFGHSDFLGSERKFGQSQFLETSPCLYNYFEDLSINLKSA